MAGAAQPPSAGRGRPRDGEVLAVHLVAIGQHRDQVLPVWKRDTGRLVQVRLGTLCEDGRPAGRRMHARPVATVGVVRIADCVGG